MAINLVKPGDTHTIDLKKDSKGKNDLTGITVHANLNWKQPKKGLVSKFFASDPPDLDLGCMYKLKTGNIGIIQPLGNAFGSKGTEPFILLDKDDRTGDSDDGENMVVYRPDLIRRIIFFAFIYKGAQNFVSVGGHMRFQISNGETVTLKLDNPDNSSKFCVAAMIENNNGVLTIHKTETYCNSHQQAARHYKFDFEWNIQKKN